MQLIENQLLRLDILSIWGAFRKPFKKLSGFFVL
jgi:hypothetical protein